MTYLVTDNCVKCKHMDCIEVCPIDCFYEGENMLVINPDECIDCGVCVPECPVDAIVHESELGPKNQEEWLNINRTYAQRWPNITGKKPEDIPNDAKDWEYVPLKFPKYFSPKPGKGD